MHIAKLSARIGLTTILKLNFPVSPQWLPRIGYFQTDFETRNWIIPKYWDREREEEGEKKEKERRAKRKTQLLELFETFANKKRDKDSQCNKTHGKCSSLPIEVFPRGTEYEKRSPMRDQNCFRSKLHLYETNRGRVRVCVYLCRILSHPSAHYLISSPFCRHGPASSSSSSSFSYLPAISLKSFSFMNVIHHQTQQIWRFP